MRNGNREALTINVTLMANKLATDDNRLYTIIGSLGALFLLEKMLNVLDLNTSGAIDMTFNGSVFTLRQYEYTIDQTNDLVEINVELTMQTADYILGAR
jgi:hypothetical protein